MANNYKCLVLPCQSTAKTRKDLKFHRLPTSPERCKYWLEACQRTDLIGKNFSRKFVCSLHFDRCQYQFGMLLKSAVPIFDLTVIPDVQSSCTQTRESIQFFGPSSDHSDLSGTLLTKIEVRSSQTQTNITLSCDNNINIKNESDMTNTLMDEHKYNYYSAKQTIEEYDNQLKIYQAEINEDDLEENKFVVKINEDIKPQIIIDNTEETSSDSGEESEDESSEMSIDEFLNLNSGLESQIRKELTKNNIPQIPIEKATSSTANLEIWEPKINENEAESVQNSEVELVRTSVNEFIIDLNQGLEEQIGKAIIQKNTANSNEPTNSRCEYNIRLHKETQTEYVNIYNIPKNNKCFQQCLRCGKNASRLMPKFTKSDFLVTIEDFENACERFLSPMFSTTIKNQIKLESILRRNRYYSYKVHSNNPKDKVVPKVKNKKKSSK